MTGTLIGCGLGLAIVIGAALYCAWISDKR